MNQNQVSEDGSRPEPSPHSEQVFEKPGFFAEKPSQGCSKCSRLVWILVGLLTLVCVGSVVSLVMHFSNKTDSDCPKPQKTEQRASDSPCTHATPKAVGSAGSDSEPDERSAEHGPSLRSVGQEPPDSQDTTNDKPRRCNAVKVSAGLLCGACLLNSCSTAAATSVTSESDGDAQELPVHNHLTQPQGNAEDGSSQLTSTNVFLSVSALCCVWKCWGMLAGANPDPPLGQGDEIPDEKVPEEPGEDASVREALRIHHQQLNEENGVFATDHALAMRLQQELNRPPPGPPDDDNEVWGLLRMLGFAGAPNPGARGNGGFATNPGDVMTDEQIDNLDYEGLSQINDGVKLNPATVEQISTLPDYFIKPVPGDGENKKSDNDDNTTCRICLELFADTPEEKVRRLRCASHIFHTKCIDKWLLTQNACPICKVRAV